MSQPKFKIKKGDKVVVTTGRAEIKGKTGIVAKVLPKEGRVIVEGVNLVVKHLKVSPQNPEGIVTKEASIHISNVALCDSESEKPTKVGYRILENGDKIRFSKRTGKNID